MGLIPRSFLDDLLSQTDIVTLIDSYVPLKKQGANFVACCPFHHEKTPSFNVIPKKQFYHCFGCGASGNAISFTMSYLNQNFSDTIEQLAQRIGLQVPRDGKQEEKPQKSLYQLLAQVALLYQKALPMANKPGLNYLEQRGVIGEVVQLYQIGYAPPGWQTLEKVKPLKPFIKDLITTGMLIQKENSTATYDRYRHRLMFPIHDRQGRIIGFGGRALDDTQKPKYLNSPETLIFHKNRELYGLHQVLLQQSKPPAIIIVEGYMDVIALAQMGVRNAVAALGTATSTYHIQLLAKYTAHIIFCFDGDLAGQQAALRALDNLLPALDTTLNASFIFLPEEHDPDSYIRTFGKEAFEQKLTHAISLHQYLFNLLLKDIDILSVAGKNQLIHKAKPYLHKIPECPFKTLLLNELARLTSLDIDKINQFTQEKENISTQPASSTIRRTPLRIATAILVQHPEIYSQLIAAFPAELFKASYPILFELMQMIQQNANIHAASLIEMFRESSWFDSLNKLTAWDHLIPSEMLAKELSEVLLFLIEKTKDQEIQMLIMRAKNQSLTLPEQQKLQQLLQQKKSINYK